MFAKVSVFFESRGYGWLRRTDDPRAEEVFFHRTELPEEWHRGKKVPHKGLLIEFDIGLRNGRECARNCRPILNEEDGTPASEVVPNVGE